VESPKPNVPQSHTVVRRVLVHNRAKAAVSGRGWDRTSDLPRMKDALGFR